MGTSPEIQGRLQSTKTSSLVDNIYNDPISNEVTFTGTGD